MRDFFTKDPGWKIFSLVLAIIMWFTVSAVRRDELTPSKPFENQTTHTFADVPVLVVSSAADVREFKVSPSVVQVTVSGRHEEMDKLEQKNIHVIVDLTGVEAAQDLKKRVDVSTPPGVTFVSAEPAEVDVMVPPRRKFQP